MFADGRAPGLQFGESRPRPDVDRWMARPLSSVRRPPLKHDALGGMPSIQREGKGGMALVAR